MKNLGPSKRLVNRCYKWAGNGQWKKITEVTELTEPKFQFKINFDYLKFWFGFNFEKKKKLGY